MDTTQRADTGTHAEQRIEMQVDTDLDGLDGLYPLIATPKLDGVGCRLGVGHDGPEYHSGRPVENKVIRERLMEAHHIALALGVEARGELWAPYMAFEAICSIVRSRETSEAVAQHIRWVLYHISGLPARTLLGGVAETHQRIHDDWVTGVPVANRAELEQLLRNESLRPHAEGLVLRDPGDTEGHIIKLKFVRTWDGVIVAMEQGTSKAGTPLDRVTVLTVRLHGGQRVRVANGWPHGMGRDMLANEQDYLGQWCEVSGRGVTSNGLPRCPSFVRLRPPKVAVETGEAVDYD